MRSSSAFMRGEGTEPAVRRWMAALRVRRRSTKLFHHRGTEDKRGNSELVLDEGAAPGHARVAFFGASKTPPGWRYPAICEVVRKRIESQDRIVAADCATAALSPFSPSV